MSYDSRGQRYCDGCGRAIEKAHRVFESQDFCGACYKRVFVATECARCQTTYRRHPFDASPCVCSACQRVDRTCVRCSRPVAKAGKIVDGKAACQACAPYYNVKKTCPACGVTSMRLSRDRKRGIFEAVCDRCRTNHHRTCSRCSRSRPIARTVSSRFFCSDCVPGAEISHACPMCATELPGGGNGLCRSCLNVTRILEEFQDHDTVADQMFHRFVGWLHQRQGSEPDFVKTVRRHKVFFDVLGPSLQDNALTGELLLRVYGTAELRKHKLATDFLTARYHVQFDLAQKLEVSQRAMIRSLLEGAVDSPFEQLIWDYGRYLTQRQRQIRTLRAYLTAAIAFCRQANVNGPWRQPSLIAFLKGAPGYATSLSPFVTYCRDTLLWDVELPGPADLRRDIPVEGEIARVRKILADIERQGVQNVTTKALETLFARLLSYRLKDFREVGRTLRLHGTRWAIEDAGHIVIPAALSKHAAELFRRYRAAGV